MDQWVRQPDPGRRCAAHGLGVARAALLSAPVFSGMLMAADPASQVLAAISNQSKIYGDPDPPPSAIAVRLTPVNRRVSTWGGDVAVDDTGKVAASVVGLERESGENVGVYRYTSVSLSGLTGSAAGNYSNRANIAGSATLTITPRRLIVTAVADSKSYDGTVHCAAVPTVRGLHAGDHVLASQSFDSAHVGDGKTLTPAAVIRDGNGGANYQLQLIAHHGGVITDMRGQ